MICKSIINERVQIAPFCTSENLGCIVSFAWLLANNMYAYVEVERTISMGVNFYH